MTIRSQDWSVTEAFDKFGFGDGDGVVHTDMVAGAIEGAGYTVEHQQLGMHNDVITRIGIWEFDGYHVPSWATLPLDLQQELLELDPDLDWDEEVLSWTACHLLPEGKWDCDDEGAH